MHQNWYIEALEAKENKDVTVSPQTISSFTAKEQKLLLLFAHNETEKNNFKNLSEELRKVAEKADTPEYRKRLNDFSNRINQRVLKEWKAIKSIR